MLPATYDLPDPNMFVGLLAGLFFYWGLVELAVWYLRRSESSSGGGRVDD
jgi:hypothetical protein